LKAGEIYNRSVGGAEAYLDEGGRVALADGGLEELELDPDTGTASLTGERLSLQSEGIDIKSGYVRWVSAAAGEEVYVTNASATPAVPEARFLETRVRVNPILVGGIDSGKEELALAFGQVVDYTTITETGALVTALPLLNGKGNEVRFLFQVTPRGANLPLLKLTCDASGHVEITGANINEMQLSLFQAITLALQSLSLTGNTLEATLANSIRLTTSALELSASTLKVGAGQTTIASSTTPTVTEPVMGGTNFALWWALVQAAFASHTHEKLGGPPTAPLPPYAPSINKTLLQVE